MYGVPMLAACEELRLIHTCRAVSLPCRVALIHTCRAVSLPSSDSAVSFVKLRVVAGRNRTWPDRPQAAERRPTLIHTYHAVPLPSCAMALKSRFQSGVVRARQGLGMVCVNQKRSRCVSE
jgi:hypothetical protein